MTRNAYDAIRDRISPLPPVVTPVSSCSEPPARANLLPAFPASFVCDGSGTTAWVTPLAPAQNTPRRN